jgi:hypothetical protein
MLYIPHVFGIRPSDEQSKECPKKDQCLNCGEIGHRVSFASNDVPQTV